MTLLLLIGLAAAGELQLESDVPLDLLLDGRPAASLFGPARLTLRHIPPGPHELLVVRGPEGTPLTVNVPAEGAARLHVTATTLTLLDPPLPRDEAALGAVELRVAEGSASARVTWGEQRADLPAGGSLRLTGLSPGEWPLELRSVDGTAVWARGHVVLRGGDTLVVLISEGRAPVVLGADDAWRSAR